MIGFLGNFLGSCRMCRSRAVSVHFCHHIIIIGKTSPYVGEKIGPILGELNYVSHIWRIRRIGDWIVMKGVQQRSQQINNITIDRQP
jgi:hypothetical protein